MIKEIKREILEELRELFISAFNAPPWNDKWTVETANKRLLDYYKYTRLLWTSGI